MSDVRERLVEYRQSKASRAKVEPSQLKERREVDKEETRQDVNSRLSLENVEESRNSPTPWYVTALRITLWTLLWGFCIELEVGVVYIVLSGLFLMAYSLYGSRRKSYEPSAYSVFNKGCENIDGTLTAAQFERELRYGPTSVKT